LMHVFEAGPDNDEYNCRVRFECPKCGHRTEWMQCRTVTEAKRGSPCPECNSKMDGEACQS
jgi:predicted nucleic acid-binding Zn ribbon protein